VVIGPRLFEAPFISPTSSLQHRLDQRIGGWQGVGIHPQRWFRLGLSATAALADSLDMPSIPALLALGVDHATKPRVSLHQAVRISPVAHRL
jgi:hypothetical protein